MSFRRDRSSRRTGGFLKPHDEQLVRLGRLAERYFPEDPNTCLLKLRQLSELLAQLTATRVRSYVSTDEKQFELLQRLEREKILMREVMKELTSGHACGICHVPCKGVEPMIYLVLGLVLFLGMHSISIIAPAWRDRIAARLGHAWRGIYSLISIAGFIVIIWGYGIARRNPVMLCAPPAWTHYITAVVMLPVFTLFLAAYLPGRIKGTFKHPMLLSVMLWAVAHLIATGMLADVVLFGSFLAWAVANRISFRWRTQRPMPMAPSMKLNDGIAIVAGLVVYVIFEHWLHVRWIGVQPLPM